MTNEERLLRLEHAKKMLRLWLEAEEKLAGGQSYQIGSRRLTRVDLDDVYKAQDRWAAEIEALESGVKGLKVSYITPIGF